MEAHEAIVEEDEYADMPPLIHLGVHVQYEGQDLPPFYVLYEQGPFLAVMHVQPQEDKSKSEALDLVQALVHVADLQSEPTELAISDEDSDYITGELLVRGQHGFVLDDCRNAPLLRETLRQLVEVHNRFCNPMTNKPIMAVHKVLFV